SRQDETDYFIIQAEDGIRDRNVTGVQTCALPIFTRAVFMIWMAVFAGNPASRSSSSISTTMVLSWQAFSPDPMPSEIAAPFFPRSEERRVGKECIPQSVT